MARTIVKGCVLALLLIAGNVDGAAAAGKYMQEIKAGVTLAEDDSERSPFHVSVESRSVDGFVIYTITNLGDDWPSHVFAGVFGSASGALFDNRRTRLKSGEQMELVADFKGHKAFSLDFIVRPRWVQQEFVVRFAHITPPGWREAGLARVQGDGARAAE